MTDHPGIRSVRRSQSAVGSNHCAIAERKHRLEQLLRECDLADHGKGAEAADVCGVHKSTLFGWRDVRAQNRGPTDEALAKLEVYAEERAAHLRFIARFSRSA